MSTVAQLERLLADAEANLAAAAGSSSLCSISRSGAPMPGIKYPEGAWVALRDVSRALKQSADPHAVPGAQVDVAIADVRQRWAADLAHHTAAGSGENWISYLTGGLDALDELAESSPQ